MKNTLASQTFDKVKQAFADQRLFLVPIGSTEPHGNYTPMGDYRLVDKLAGAIAERTGAIVTPTLPFGHATYFQNATGGIALTVETFSAVFREIVTSLVRDGARNILILNGHGGNTGVIANQLRLIRADHGIVIPSVNVWAQFDNTLWKSIQPELGTGAKGHGTEPMGSLNRYLFPEDCPEQLDDDASHAKQPLGLPFKSLHQCRVGDLDVEMPLFVEDISDQAKVNPRDVRFSAKAGAVLFDDIRDKTIRFIESHFHLTST